MKKLFALFLLFCVLMSSLTACKSKDIPEETTKAAVSTTEQPETTAEQPQETTEEETEPIKTETIKVSNEKHQFTFEKTNFEDNYSEEFLEELSILIPMDFGYEDYENWDGTPNEILNDVYHSGYYWRIGGYDYESEEWNAAKSEIEKNLGKGQYSEYTVTDIDKINSYLRDLYGPKARVFNAEDFDTCSEIKTDNDSIFTDYDWSFIFVYLPESELIVQFARETYGGEMEPVHICDIKTSNDCYIVEAAEEVYGQYCIHYILKIVCDDNGDLYMKSADKSYILPDNAAMNYKVTSEENVKVEVEKYYSSDWEVIDTLSNGEEFYSPGYYYDDDYVSIVTEEYYGRVEKKYVTEIE